MNMLFEAAAVVVWAWLMVTQVIGPIARGTPMFPLLDRRVRREAHLRHELELAEQANVEQDLVTEVERVRAGLRRKAGETVAAHSARAYRIAVDNLADLASTKADAETAPPQTGEHS